MFTKFELRIVGLNQHDFINLFPGLAILTNNLFSLTLLKKLMSNFLYNGVLGDSARLVSFPSVFNLLIGFSIAEILKVNSKIKGDREKSFYTRKNTTKHSRACYSKAYSSI